jgi:aminocarboxymuconate-semialdehyde decarboxylase
MLKKKPSSYLKRFFYDTITFDAGLLENLIERVGAKQVMLGSDYPFDMGDEDPVGLVQGLRGIEEAERERILGGTAARLLKIKRSPT